MLSRHKHLFLVFLFLIFLAGASLLAQKADAGFFPSHLKYYTVKTEHYYLHFPEGIGPLATDLQTIAEDAYTRITSRLGWRPWGRIHLILSDKTDEANGMASVIPYNYILLYMSPPEDGTSLDHYKDYLTLLMNHELTHIIHIDMHYRFASPARFLFGRVAVPNAATPGWMREGMAVYEESMIDEDFGRINSDNTMMVLRTAYYENTFPRLDQIAGLSKHFPGPHGPYLFGGMFFDWLAKTYGEERMYKFQKEYASGLWVFSLNNKARRVYGKSFYKLYKEFQAHYASIFETQKQELEALGITPMEDVIKNKNFQTMYTPNPDGIGYAYYEYGYDEKAGINIFLDSQKEPQVIKRKPTGQLSFSQTGRYLAFSSLSALEPNTAYSDVYYYDTEKKTLHRVFDKTHAKKSMRARDPDFSSADNGQRWIVMVRNFLNTDQLYVYDLYGKKGYVITDAPKFTQFSSPRFSPDGSKIVVSRHDPQTGFRDIVMYSKTGEELYKITNDVASDYEPVFSPQGFAVYFTSYQTGVANIFSFNTETKKLSQITNVLDGVFQPMPAPHAQELYVQRYNSDKTYIQKFYPSQHSSFLNTSHNNSALKEGLSAKISSHRFAISSEGLAIEKPATDATLLAAQIPATEDKTPTTTIAPQQAFTQKNPTDLNTSFDYINPVLKFSLNPDSDELLPDFLYGNSGNSKTQAEAAKTKEDATETSAEKKDYPSLYKDQLSRFPDSPTLDMTNPEGTKKYHVLPQLLVPRYLLPGFLFYENSILLSAAIGRTDPLFRHSWSALTNYRSDAQFVGGGASYVYSRYKPLFYLGGLRYAVDWGTVNGANFFEQRHQGYAGMSWALKRHRFNVAYFYEYRDALTNVGVNLINMQPYAGTRFQYSIRNYKKPANAISPENGYQFKFAGEWTDQYLGADAVNEEIAIRGDLRFYLEMPWSQHHVFATRVAAGWVWGDQQQFGVYRLGGPFGEGTGAGYSSRVFPLRGLAGITYGGDQVFLASAEYRIPLVTNVNWGIGTWPIFVDKIHMALFVDGGDIRYRTDASDLFSRFLLSTGAEINGDFVLGYGLPVTVRLGYGLVMTNRWRLGTLVDAITYQPLTMGSVYLQFGTMF